MPKQYFSKTKRRWIDFKSTDSEVQLKKYFYRIRIKPTRYIKTPRSGPYHISKKKGGGI